ncbi:hypothetical protein PROSTU_02369 [Providencia stuartii ATCC 25827]|uniref:Uncharacterized protein n=1 Tax=Providencia stuartii ATCC 25827 TaxID=471874 RepID=A0AA86YJ22_PROST|nr:hypothetical protein PROSTU_02369 [Providencia stuartii ATCC 25827]
MIMIKLLFGNCYHYHIMVLLNINNRKPNIFISKKMPHSSETSVAFV